MRARAFWKAVTVDGTDFLDRLIGLLRDKGIRFCVVDGQAVNAYAEPVVSLDLDLVVAVEQLAETEALLRREFTVERFEHSLNVSEAGSDLRVQLTTDARYFPFVARAAPREVLGITLPVAGIEDVLQGKVWVVTDETRRASKRQKDLADIARILETRPDLRKQVPADVLARLA